MTITTEKVRTDALVEGDVVRTDGGLRVKISGRREWDNRGVTVVAFDGEIQNPEVFETREGRYLFGGVIALDGSDLRWTVQGVEWLLWTREV